MRISIKTFNGKVSDSPLNLTKVFFREVKIGVKNNNTIINKKFMKLNKPAYTFLSKPLQVVGNIPHLIVFKKTCILFNMKNGNPIVYLKIFVFLNFSSKNSDQ
jgi:hypothetical protein